MSSLVGLFDWQKGTWLYKTKKKKQARIIAILIYYIEKATDKYSKAPLAHTNINKYINKYTHK